MKEFNMTTRSVSHSSILKRIREAVKAADIDEQHRRNLADLLALAWDARRSQASNQV